MTSVLRDSTNDDSTGGSSGARTVEFRWYLTGTKPVIVTDTNAVAGTAAPQAGTVRHVVVADAQNSAGPPASREFVVQISASNDFPDSTDKNLVRPH